MTAPYAPVSRIASRSPTSTGGSARSRAERVGRLADGPDDVGANRRARRAARTGSMRVPRAVERGPQQVRHAGVDDDEPAAVGPALQIDDLGDEHAGRADDPAAGLEHEREARSTHGGEQRGRVVLDGDDGLSRLVRDAESAAEVEVLERMPSSARARARGSTTRLAPRAQAARRVVICDPTCTCRPTTLQAGPARHVAHHARARRRRTCRTSSRAMPGGDVRMAAGVDVRIDAHGHARDARRARRAIASIRSTSPGDSALMARDAEADGALEFRARLADAGEDDVVGREPGAQRDLDLAAGVGVGARRRARAAAGRPRASRWP